MVLLSPGLTITSSTRTVSQCLLGPTLLLSSTTEPWAPGSGKDKCKPEIWRVKKKYSKHNNIMFSYDFDTGALWQVHSSGPQRRCHQSLTRGIPPSRFRWIFCPENKNSNLRCAQRWLLWRPWWQMSRWSWTIEGEWVMMMISYDDVPKWCR